MQFWGASQTESEAVASMGRLVLPGEGILSIPYKR